MPWAATMRLALKWKVRSWRHVSWACGCCWLAASKRYGRSWRGISSANLAIEMVNATDVITMTDSPSHAFRRKKESSVHVAARLVRDGKADALVSAGNTGAVMTVARFVIGTLPSVDRPALAAAFPNMKEKISIILDVGANVDSKPTHIEQFAVMGEIYYRAIWGVKRPRVALLSIGEEEAKGNELDSRGSRLLKQLPLNFVGNVEGRDVFRGNVDVIVCDGFIGNVALKLSEGLVEHIGAMLKKAIKSSLRRKLATRFRSGRLTNFRKRTDYSEYGGAPLAGRPRHHHHRPRAVECRTPSKMRIRVAAELCRARVNEKIEQELSAAASSPRPRLKSSANRNPHEQACFPLSRTGLAISGHGPGSRRKFPGVARRIRRSRCRSGIRDFESVLRGQ